MQGYDHIWVISDQFGFQSYEEHFKQRSLKEHQGYMRENFEVTGYITGRFASPNPNLISRLCNSLVSAMKSNPLLPKYVVIVPDDDMIKYLHHYGSGISNALGRLVDKVMGDHEKSTSSHKDYLPEKCKRDAYPYFIWIQAPLHININNNPERVKFNHCIDRMTKFHSKVLSLQLKKIWDPQDTNLFIKESNRFTCTGFSAYWNAVDKTVKYCDTILIKKLLNAQSKKLQNVDRKKFNKNFFQKGQFQTSNDRFRWTKQKGKFGQGKNYQKNETLTSETGRRKLPTPPPED